MYSRGSGIIYLVWEVIPSILDGAGIEGTERHHAYAALERFTVGIAARNQDKPAEEIADILRTYYGD